MASVGWTLRSRRPPARGDVLCAEPGRPHGARSRDERSRASRGSSKERSPAGRLEESDDCRQTLEDARAAGKDHLTQTEEAVRAVLKVRPDMTASAALTAVEAVRRS